MTEGVDRGKLGPIGLERIDKGLLCFVYLEGFENRAPRFTAVCVDLGMSASGPTVESARKKLDSLLTSFIELAAEKGSLEAILRAPPNAAAVGLYRRVQRFEKIISRLAPFVKASVVATRLFTLPPVEEYREAVEVPNTMAFA